MPTLRTPARRGQISGGFGRAQKELKEMLKVKSVALAVMVAGICALQGRLWAADQTAGSGQALALRLAEVAQRILRTESAPSDASWREGSSLLKAAPEVD